MKILLTVITLSLDFKVSDLDKIESVDLEEYMEYLKVYISEEQHKHMQNTEQGVFRKMSALRSFTDIFTNDS